MRRGPHWHPDCARLEVAFAAETRLHADFVSGTRELLALGAHVVVPAEGRRALGHLRCATARPCG